ncbi:MAG TPA: hypothetical protein VFU82_07135, partial [Gammaproteobacteria bacterium]|nr:hypothetical protein [Gammaproteobacteria bacterium]
MTANITSKITQHIDNLNYFFGVFTEKSEYTYINQTGLAWLGFKNLKNALGKDHSMVNCDARELAPIWIAQDQETLNGANEQFIGLNHYANDEWKLVHVEKNTSFLNEKKEIICIVRDMSHYPTAFIPPIIKNELIQL